MIHLGDITKINGAEIEPVDVITGGSPCQDLSIAGKRAGLAGARSGLFMEQIRIVKEMRQADERAGRTGEFIRPRYMVWENVCFAGDTLVATRNGYKRIDQIAVGDKVKTHTGQYRPVAKTMRTKNQAVVRLKVSGAEDIICTPNHPLYVMEKIYADAGRKQGRSFTEPRWEAAGNLNERCMVAYKLDVPMLPENFITPDEAWALGRYIADGSVDLNRGTPRIFISVGNAKLEEARERLHRLTYEIHENAPHATATNMVFSSQEFYNLVSGEGKGAGKKRVPPFVFDLPTKLQRRVLDGYISGDGYIRKRGRGTELCCSTASRELAYGIARIIRNVYQVGANISVSKPKNGTIEGRIIKANYPCFSVTASLTNKVSTSVCKDGFMWQMVKGVEPCKEKVDVYNLSVLEDNTYGANDVVVHNCGAFSSNKGRDFAAVLEEIIRIAEPEAPDIEVPEKGWPTWGGYHDCMGGRWSVAWRVHDAQHWGVPQRRRRISIVADFGGDTASEISFERKSVSGDIAPRGAAGEEAAGDSGAGAYPAIARSLTARCDGSPCIDRGPNIVCAEQCLTPWDCQSKRIFGTDGKCPTLQGGVGGGVNNPAIFCQSAIAIPINDKATRYAGGGSSRNHDGSGNGLGVGKDGDPSPTITAGDRHIVAAFKAGNGAKANGIGYAEECAPTLCAVSSGLNQCPSVLAFDRAQITSPDNRSTIGPDKPCPTLHTFGEVPAVCYQMQGFSDYREGDIASSCKQRDYKDSTDLVVSSVDCRNFTEGGEINGTLQAKESGGQSLNLQNTVRTGMVVRRLTPMECERLQGYPDGWTDIGEWRDSKGKLHKDADSPRYKACGNSIALPFWQFLAKRISAQYLRPVTMGSLFDGIGGFALVFERCNGKGTARWASEIEEFPIAVTKLRFEEE